VVVRPCQPAGSSSWAPPPVSWPGLPDDAAGTVDQVIGGSDGSSVGELMVRLVPVGVGAADLTGDSA
jgi:hypothetical protein